MNTYQLTKNYRLLALVFACLISQAALRGQTSAYSLQLYWDSIQQVLNYPYTRTTPIDRQYAIVGNDWGWGVIDSRGRVTIPVEYYRITQSKHYPLLIVGEGDYGGSLRHPDGTVVLPKQTYSIDEYENGFKTWGTDNLFHFFDTRGKPVKVPAWREKAGLVQGKYYVTWDNNQGGLKDTLSDRWVIPPAYQKIYPIGNGYWEATVGTHTRLLNPTTGWTSKHYYENIALADSSGFWAFTLVQSGDYEDFWYESNYATYFDWNEHEVEMPFNLLWKTDSMLIISKNGKTGILDKQYRVLLKPEYSNANLASRSNDRLTEYVQLWKDNQCGWFDGHQWVVPLGNYKIQYYDSGAVCFGKDSFFVFDLMRHTRVALPGKMNYISDEWIYNDQFSDSIYHLHSGWVKVYGQAYPICSYPELLSVKKKDGHYELMEPNGKVLLSGLESINKVPEKTQFTFTKNSQPGFYQYNIGMWLFPGYDEVSNFSGPFFLVKKSLKWGVADTSGAVVVPLVYDDAVKEGRLLFLKKNGFWNIYRPDMTLMPVDSITNYARYTYTKPQYIWLERKGQWLLCDSNGRNILPTSSGQNRLFTFFSDYLSYPNLQQKWGVVRRSDNRVVLPFEYDKVFDISRVLYAQKGNQIVVLDSLFQIKNQFQADSIFTDKFSLSLVKQGNSWYLVDQLSAPVFNQPYQQVLKYNWGRIEYLAQRDRQNWDCVDFTGQVVQSFRADTVVLLRGGYLELVRDQKRWIYSVDNQMERLNLYDEVHIGGQFILVRQGAKKGAFNLTWEPILPIQYTEIWNYDNDSRHLFVMNDLETGLVDMKGQVCIPLDSYTERFKQIGEDLIVAQKDKRMGLYSISNKTWTPNTDLESISACEVRLPLEKSLYTFYKNGQYGLMDEDCLTLLPPQYESIESRGNRLVLQQKQQFFLYNPLTLKKMPFPFIRLFNDENAFAGQVTEDSFCLIEQDRIISRHAGKLLGVFETNLVFQSGKYQGLMRFDGVVLLPARYTSISDLGSCLQVRQQDQTGLFDKAGKMIIPVQYNELNSENEKSYVVRKGNLYGLYDCNGKQLLATQYECLITDHMLEQFLVKQQGRWFHLNSKGERLNDKTWEMAGLYYKGIAPVCKDNRWGYVDLDGNMLIPFEYEYATEFHTYSFNDSPVAIVLQNDRVLTIDETGKIIDEGGFGSFMNLRSIFHSTYYKEITTNIAQKLGLKSYTYSFTLFTNGFYVVEALNDQRKLKWGLSSMNGAWVVQPVYDEINMFAYSHKHHFAGRCRSGKQWYLIDRQGKVLSDASYDEANESMSEDFITLKKDGKTLRMWASGRVEK